MVSGHIARPFWQVILACQNWHHIKLLSVRFLLSRYLGKCLLAISIDPAPTGAIFASKVTGHAVSVAIAISHASKSVYRSLKHAT